MKKFFLFLVIASFVSLSAGAQVDRNALGVRLGGGASFGGEFSYQLGFSNVNRLELDLGFGGDSDYSRMSLAGTYQWVWPIGGDGFNWFVGPGAGISLNNGKKDHNDYFGMAIGGQIGLGYNFKIPLGLTLDTRPMWDFLSDDNGFNWGLALGVRYRF